ncbi:MAG: ATP-binding protein [Prevotellaceae bacterium]|nr:ATP-binding protein [Candidatus Faecinaster equi]
MIARYYQLTKEVTDGSVFLFGARQTGKSTFLEQHFKDAIFFDLLDSKLKMRFRNQPSLLYEILQDKPSETIVIIDEIQEVPELLNEIHRLIQKNNLRFVLCGSSARKLKRKGYNTLGGRAFPCYFYPFVSVEIPELDLDKVLLYGMLPPHYLAKNPKKALAGYIDIYLKEEIKEEALSRKIEIFQRFMDVAALSSGEIINYTNIASDCGVSAKTIKEYFTILEDTLIGYMVPAYTKTQKRKVMQAPKFYYFDVGIYNYLMKRDSLASGTPEYGHAFEHFVMQELWAYIGYTHNPKAISYWHTYNNKEIDAVIGNAEIGIEIKSTEEILPRHLSNFKDYQKEYPESRCIMVSRDKMSRRNGNIEILYVFDFLRMLWNGELF